MNTLKFGVFLVFLIIPPLFLGCTSKPPELRGIHDGRLPDCPKTPNCVSTMTTRSEHLVNQLNYSSSREEAKRMIKEVIYELGNASLEEEKTNYFWVECRSRWLGFVDDLEIYFPEKEKVIHMRSASRLGYSDLGVNAKRIEHISKLFHVKEQIKDQP